MGAPPAVTATDKPRDAAFMLEQLTALAEASAARPSRARGRPATATSGEPDLLALAARRASGETYAAIAADLNRRGIRGRYGARWYSASVWTLLHRQRGS